MSTTTIISIALSCMAMTVMNLRAIKEHIESILIILDGRDNMGKKMNNIEYTNELMYGVEGEGCMSDKHRLIFQETSRQYDNGTMDGKECRKIIAHTILDCYQMMDNQDVKTAFRQIYKKYMNSDRDRISGEESDIYVEFMQYIRGNDEHIKE